MIRSVFNMEINKNYVWNYSNDNRRSNSKGFGRLADYREPKGKDKTINSE